MEPDEEGRWLDLDAMPQSWDKNLWNEFYGLMHRRAMWRGYQEPLQGSPDDAEQSAWWLTQWVQRNHIETQAAAIRRIVDRTRDQRVVSIGRLLDDIAAHPTFLDGDPDATAKEARDDADHAFEGGKSRRRLRQQVRGPSRPRSCPGGEDADGRPRPGPRRDRRGVGALDIRVTGKGELVDEPIGSSGWRRDLGRDLRLAARARRDSAERRTLPPRGISKPFDRPAEVAAATDRFAASSSDSVTPSGPGPPRDPEPGIARFVEACSADERIVAAFLAGSVARGEADEFSDIDLCVITTDDAYGEVLAGRAGLIERMGDPLFLEDFGLQGIVFVVLADGSEWELLFFRESDLGEIHVGAYRPLLDKKGILTGAAFPWSEPDRAELLEQLRRILHWFWHDLSHFIAAFGRGHLWWAFGQLEALRAYCVNLARIEQNVEAQDEAYEKLDVTISTIQLAALRSTFCPMEERAILEAVLEIVAFYRERAPAVARAYGLTYPAELERLISSRLDELVGDLR